MTKTLILKKEKDLIKLGQRIGQNLGGGYIIELVGPLGAGKTTLAKGILAGAGARGGFSPTFILKAVFRARKGDLKEIHHLDLYRLKTSEELTSLGVYDDVGRKDLALIIEWADRFPIVGNQAKLRIDIDFSKNGRKLKFKAYGQKHEELLQNSLLDFI